jgi:hypothetical protein
MHLLLALLLATSACALDDFERPEAGITGLGAAQMSLVPDVTGSALSLGWPAQHGRWVECVYQQPRPVAGLAAGEPVLLRLQVRSAPGVRQLGVRLIDARNEVWQWSLPLPTDDGWMPLVLPIALERADGHWGGDNDGVAQPPMRLLGFSAGFADDHIPAGAILLDDLAVRPLLQMRLVTDRFPGLVDTRCDLVLVNPGDEALRVEAATEAVDWGGAKCTSTAQLNLPAGGDARVPLPLSPRAGLHRLAWTLRTDGVVLSGHGTAARTAVVPAGIRDDFRFGICSHSEAKPADEQERELRAAASAGASVVRCGVYWSGLEPKPGVWNWTVQDHLVDFAASVGLETQPILGFTASHAASPAAQAAMAEGYRRHDPNAWKLTAMSPPEDAPWRRYVAAIAERYRGRIRMYEVWNEPDLGFWIGGVDDYLRMLAAASEEIHRADPQAEVLTGGFATALAHAGRARNPDMQERVLAQAAATFDVHAFHGHGPFEEFVRGLAVLDGWRSRMTVPRPLYLNETALSAYGGGNAAERTQAVELVKKMSWAVSIGAIGYTWYELRDGGSNPADPEHHYGLLDTALQPKPAFAAYAETVRRLRGARPLGRLDLGPGVFALAFAQPERRIVVLWREGRDTAEEPWLLRVGPGTVRRCDLMGEPEDLPVVDGLLLVQAAAEPVFFELPPGDTAPAVAGPLLRITGADEVEAGQPATFTVSCRPPLRITWPGADGAPMSQQLENVTGSLISLARSAGESTLEVAYESAGTPWRGVLRQPLRLVHSLPVGPIDGHAPDFVLSGEGDVVSFCRADPQLVAQVWSGPDDLSANVWLTRDGDRIRLRIVVRDDVHSQREEAAMQWRGDGVQFAFRLPGHRDGLEFGVAQRDDGTVLRHTWSGPQSDMWDAAVTPSPGGLRYDISLSCATIGLNETALAQGFGFNLIVNDNDGPLREGFVRIAPGIGEGKDPGAFPTVRFRP